MKTVVDTNVIVALWDASDSLNSAAQSALDAGLANGGLVIPSVVYAELLAFAGRTEHFLDSFFRETGIVVDWHIPEKVWRLAGSAFQSYATRRKKHGEAGPRRILADFLIGAYASASHRALLTLDERLYRAAFPGLKIITF